MSLRMLKNAIPKNYQKEYLPAQANLNNNKTTSPNLFKKFLQAHMKYKIK